ncbi:MAG TPA: cell division ATP-binding protein FtsE [Candidatus Paceibacterota bacterium]|nr:cell division ATP-binding protein FtsE [Candidatus Paceibacterota bacterium]
MIKFQSVNKIYPPNTIALNDVSFEVGPKEFVCLVGKSGAGKTTLLKLLMAEESPSSGQVFFDSQDVQLITSEHLPDLRRKIGAVFQDYKLLPSKTAYENVAYALEAIGASDEEIIRDVAEVLDIVGLKEKASNFPAQLSGGEKQRVAIARALIHRPEVILADEPTGNLDPYNTLDIIRLLLKINEFGTTVVLSTHNREVVNSLAKRAITLNEGKIIRDEKIGRFIL